MNEKKILLNRKSYEITNGYCLHSCVQCLCRPSLSSPCPTVTTPTTRYNYAPPNDVEWINSSVLDSSFVCFSFHLRYDFAIVCVFHSPHKLLASFLLFYSVRYFSGCSYPYAVREAPFRTKTASSQATEREKMEKKY